MEKPKSLRALLCKCIPDLVDNPSKIEMYAHAGKIRAWLSKEHMSYEYHYDLEITVLNFSAPPDTVFMPIVAWLASHEVAALQNHDRNAFDFEVDILDEHTVDISITLKLTEAIDVIPRKGGGHTLQARKETPLAGDDDLAALMQGLPPCVRLKQIYDQNDNLIVPYPEPEPAVDG
ncbi:hypothetical protein MMA231_02477 [Asticcacaulis sp. MM231]|uniref:phage tail protein n=1 Tax=Asticcacaulis sp. MM231 TaxID=3157666 RepID=UPI0032D57B58